MKLYDSLSKTVQDIQPPTDYGKIKFYSCGPTVYNFAHIGNLRSFLFADSIRRSLEYLGNQVDWVMNITDVDDKTIKGTIAEFGPEATVDNLKTYTTKYLNIFLTELQSLNVDTEQIRFIRVADVIPQIQEYILQLVEKGYAYHTEDGTYFSIEKYQQDFGDYGELVGKGFLEGKKTGARVKVDEYEKDNLSDFALWKKHTPEDANIYWDHPTLGKGRPGWHIECSVINDIAFEHTTTDIHTGGIDLIFPHHTNEIAQSEPMYKPFVRHWAHGEHLNVDGKKMAKSAGNFYVLGDILKKISNPLAFRYLCLQTDFRKPMNFTWESVEAAQTALDRLYKQAETLHLDSLSPFGGDVDASGDREGGNKYSQSFKSALENNLNLPAAIATMWEMLGNNSLSNQDKYNLLVKMDEVLGLDIANHKATTVEIPTEVQQLVDARHEARANKDFAKSDELRVQIEAAGFEVLDTKDGQEIKAR